MVRLFATIYARVVKIIRDNFNVAALKKKFMARGQSVVEILITDNDDHRTPIFSGKYRLDDSGPTKLPDDIKPDVSLRCDYGTALDIIDGQTKRMTTDGVKYYPYSIHTAWLEGNLHIDEYRKDDTYIADLKLFEMLYEQVLPQLRKEMKTEIKV